MSIKIPKEKDIQRAIIDWLTLHGAHVMRTNSVAVLARNRNGSTRMVRANNQPGCSDIHACVGGVFVAIEIKRPGARTDPLRLAKQEAYLASVRQSQGIGIIATCVEDVIAELRKHGMEVANG